MGLRESVQKSIINYLDLDFTIQNGKVVPALLGFDGFGNYKKGLGITQGYNINADVYSIVSRTARTISNNIIWKVREVNKVTGEVENAEGTELEQLLNNPNKLESLQEFREKAISYLMTTGVNYIAGVDGVGIGGYDSIHILPSDIVDIEKGTLSEPIKGINVNWNLRNDFEIKDVGITRYPSLDYHCMFDGHSPLQSGYRLLESSNELETAESFYFKNRGVGGVVSNGSNELGMMPDEADRIQKHFNERIGGAEKFNSVLVSSANLNYQNMGMSPSDLKLLDSFPVKLRRLCALFGLDSSLFGDPASKTYNNQKEAVKSAFLNVYIPNDNKILQTLNKWLAPKYSTGKLNTYYEIYQDLSEIDVLQEDKAQLVQIQEKQSREVRMILSDIQKGFMNKEAGFVILTEVHGFDEDKAKILTDNAGIKEEANGQGGTNQV